MKKVLFICVHNSGRSQIAAEFLKKIRKGTISSESAGTTPDEKVNPTVAKVLLEKGIDRYLQEQAKASHAGDGRRSKQDNYYGMREDEACPAVFVPSEDWELDDPKGKPIEDVRKIRDIIESKVKALFNEINNLPG